MIERYSLPEMGNIWSDFTKYEKWLEVEVLAVEAWSELGEVPPEAVAASRRRPRSDSSASRRSRRSPTTTSSLSSPTWRRTSGEDSRYIHLGMTSSDVLDTGLALQMRDAVDIILAEARSPGPHPAAPAPWSSATPR